MKKSLFLLTTLALALSSTAAASMVSYTKTAVTGTPTSYGTLKAESYDVAVCLDDATLRGSKVVSVTVPMATTEGLSNPEAFITTKLQTEKVDGVRKNYADIETVNAEFVDNCLKATFSKPYELTADPIYVGFSFTIAELTESNREPLAGQAVYNAGGFYLRTTRTNAVWTDMAEKANFTSTMQITLEGDFSNAGGALRMDEYVHCEQHKAFKVPVVYLNQGASTLNSIDYSWKIGNNSGKGRFIPESPMQMDFGREYNLLFDIDADEDKGYKQLTISIDKINDVVNMHPDREASHEIRVVSRVPVRRPVVEEYTGTWCGFCTRGMAGMEHMRNTYGDDFVGLAYHRPSSAAEPMVTQTATPNNITSLPGCMIDRHDKMDPYYGRSEDGVSNSPDVFSLKKFYDYYRAQFSPASIELTATWNKENPNYIDIESEVVFVDVPNSTYGLSYILSADGIIGNFANASWWQKNYNLGMAYDIPEMEKFSRGREYMVGIEYDDVVLNSTGVTPIANSLPVDIEADVVYSHSCQMQGGSIKGPLGDELVENRDNLRMAALIIDKATNRVVNAVQVHVLADKSSISMPTEIERNEDVKYFDLQGRMVQNPANGIFIKVYKNAEGVIKSKKIAIK